MSINTFFIALLVLLLGMYGYFKPSYRMEREAKEIPKIHLLSFTLYEISHRGIDHVLEGKEGKKFEERYEITQAKFSDNTKSQFQSIRSDSALYRENILNIRGNVHYRRADGLEFRSKEGEYNTKTSVVTTQGAFVVTQNGSRIDGDRLNYNTDRDTVSANAVRGSYELD